MSEGVVLKEGYTCYVGDHPTGAKQNSYNFIVVAMVEIVSHLNITYTHTICGDYLRHQRHTGGTCVRYIWLHTHICGANWSCCIIPKGGKGASAFTACWLRDSGMDHKTVFLGETIHLSCIL